MDIRRFHARTLSLCTVMLLALAALGAVLYRTQIVRGDYYAAQAMYKISNIETVEAGRGEIVDRNGCVLVTNSITYQVTLDATRMGTADNRNRILSALVSVCDEQGVAWNDSLPVSAEPPFAYTGDEVFFYSSDEDPEKPATPTRLYKLAVAMKWITADTPAGRLPPAQILLARMAASFRLSEPDPVQMRRVVGVLYELYLRSKDVYRTTYVFARDVDVTFISRVKELGLAGVSIRPVSVRQYSTDYAAHLLGRVGLMDAEEWAYYQTVDLDGDGQSDYPMDASVGKEGVEKAFEPWLRGSAGVRSVELNTDGKAVSETWIKPPEAGGRVMLTLDIALQQKVEQALAYRIPRLSGRNKQGAAAVVIDVKDGGVLACASYPTFHLATYSADYRENAANKLKPLYNRALLGAYAPGSTFKPVTGIAGLEEGIITPTTRILDTGVYRYYSNNGPKCWIYRQYGSTHGQQTVSQAITNSCNVFFYDVGRQLGIERLRKYAALFGLGEKTGIELPESAGIMAGPEYTEAMGQTWYPGNTLSVAIGQENSQFTPVQLANYVATLVNGGTRYKVHLLRQVDASADGRTIYRCQPEAVDNIRIAPRNLDAVKSGMLALTQSGSLARYFRDLDVKVGAKTGSAQISAASSDSNAVLVCFAPYDDPEIAVAIVCERGGTGSELGAVAADIFRAYFYPDPPAGEDTTAEDAPAEDAPVEDAPAD